MTSQPRDTLPSPLPLLELGWDDFFAGSFPATPAGLVPGRVAAQHRGRLRVATAAGDTPAVLAGRLRHRTADPAALPAVGDWVALAPAPAGETAAVTHLLPRRGAFLRGRPGAEMRAQGVAANIDLALVAAALTEPLNARRLERSLALAWESGAVPLVVLTKRDLCGDVEGAVAAAASAAPGVETVAVSVATGAGLDRLLAHLRPRRTAVILGPSGVGKSTLVNALLGQARLATAPVRGDGKGRHTTTHRELFRLAGGALLIDTPGMREIALWNADGGVSATFEEVAALARRCRFPDCSHGGEPGCAVRDAVEAGVLDEDRLRSWQRLGRELDHLERRQDGAAAAGQRRHERVMQRALRRHLRHKRGP